MMKSRQDKNLKEAFVEMQKNKPDLKRTFELLQLSADKDIPEALYALGTWYLHGRYVKKNAVIAVKYFLKAIKGNDKNGFYDLAVCYEKGVGIKKDYKKAFQCYMNAALLGDKQSLYEVGRCYYYGIGISKNKTIAEIWLRHAELNGIAD